MHRNRGTRPPKPDPPPPPAKPLRRRKPPKPKSEFWGGCDGGCPHSKWCYAHRQERFPCENIKEGREYTPCIGLSGGAEGM